MKEFGVQFTTDILKIYKKLTFIPNSKAKFQKFYISTRFYIKIHWFTLYSLVRVSNIKTGLDVLITSNFVQEMDVIVKPDSKLNGTMSQLIIKHPNQLLQFLLIKPLTSINLLKEPFRSMMKNSMELKNSQSKVGLN